MNTRTGSIRPEKLLGISFTLLLILFSALPSAAQQKKKKLIQFSANNIEGDPRLGKDTKRLTGNVVFTQDDVTMYCDSAYLYGNNSLDAYDHVHIKQGDSLNLYGDVLKYDGNKKIARLEKNIRLFDNDMTLTTEHMTYDVTKKTATYLGGGTITSKDNVLTSETGYYFAGEKMLAFKRKVVLTNPQYTVNCDTLNYSTPNRIAFFFGPTWIRSKKNLIYCENGFYDTHKDLAQFNKNAYLNSDKQRLQGDSIFYDRKAGFGKAMGHVVITDTSQHLTITGDYSTHNEVSKVSYVTGHSLMQQIFTKDTLFLHADSLKATSVNDTLAWKKLKTDRKLKNKKDTLQNDSIPQIRTMFAYPHVKFFQPDAQGKCDSLVYTYNDSTMHMFKGPVLWSGGNQLNAERIEMISANGQMKLMKLFTGSFIISKEDSIRFNQVKGKNMTAYFTDNKLRKVYVEGSGQTIYYVRDKNKRTGVNKADCSDLLIYIKDNQVESISLLKKPDGILYPPKEIDPKELRLKDFKDLSKSRPGGKKDLFSW